MLWIAFKNLYLWYSEQRGLFFLIGIRCCELLSKTCIFDILNNVSTSILAGAIVVNCFQKLVSLIFWTTSPYMVMQSNMLWIAFKNLYLWYSEQLFVIFNVRHSCCELLSKTCIFDILNNEQRINNTTLTVVNCFQKLVSLIFWTTPYRKLSFHEPLWIAFKNLYLWYSEQRNAIPSLLFACCELLSKTCIFDILNNLVSDQTFEDVVVNCFQKLVSLIFWTTIILQVLSNLPLWIAFKNLYLWYSEQLPIWIPWWLQCCELLSKTCIFDILNNRIQIYCSSDLVVNCFQKLVSLIFWTTYVDGTTTLSVLWIAFKNLYLWYSEQLTRTGHRLSLRCELLSKTCIFDILNNYCDQGGYFQSVVNCFQKLVSLIFWTTSGCLLWHKPTLWIAFKNLYLWYSEQLLRPRGLLSVCCELLSKTCIFDILNNLKTFFEYDSTLWIAFKNLYLWYSEQRLFQDSLQGLVVNCFQKLVSLIFWTTWHDIETTPPALWIAFKNLYLWYSEQPTAFIRWRRTGCELLSKTCIFDILNNRSSWMVKSSGVVNCFQKLVSLIFWTTTASILYLPPALWIAFKNLYLWYSEQLKVDWIPGTYCCELLSKTCIFDILNNRRAEEAKLYFVVNCFQKLVSLIFWTTRELNRSDCRSLWIAFKNLYLWYSEQRRISSTYVAVGCELLSKTCIFDILNNPV